METQQKPTLINVIAVMTLVSGIVNLFWGLVASGTALVTIIGVVCTPFTILPTILGVFEIIFAAKLLSNPPQPVRPSQSIAIFEILCILAGNVFSMVVGILALVFYNDVIVKDYFAQWNGAPASLPDLAPAPVIEEPVIPSMEEAPAPQSAPLEQPEEPPIKPKRAPRKMAKK